MKLDLIVERYVQLRDKLAEMDAAHKDATSEIKAGMTRLENALLETLNAQGSESVRTKFGVAMKVKSTSATVGDWDSFLNYVRENQRWDMINKAANKTAVVEFKEANDDLPPGINWREAVTVQVRRA